MIQNARGVATDGMAVTSSVLSQHVYISCTLPFEMSWQPHYIQASPHVCLCLRTTTYLSHMCRVVPKTEPRSPPRWAGGVSSFGPSSPRSSRASGCRRCRRRTQRYLRATSTSVVLAVRHRCCHLTTMRGRRSWRNISTTRLCCAAQRSQGIA
jgi:hypothetical protein